MLYILTFIINLVQLVVEFIKVVLFISAIISWIPTIDRNNVLVRMVDGIVYPVIYPARLLVEKSQVMASLPFDLSYLIAYAVLTLLGTFLPRIVY